VIGHLKTDGCDEPTVEDILSHVRALRAIAGNDAARGLTAAELDMLDSAICDVIVDVMRESLPHSDTPYHRIAGWAGAIQREQPVEIFTTNYDLLMEQALEDRRVPYFDGFVGSRRAFFDLRSMEDDDVISARWARLWKLHGSINWFQDAGGRVFRTDEENMAERRVIHPSHLKYDQSRKMPYLAMIDRLGAFIKRPSSVLVICGYSFRDFHLNDVIITGLEANPSAMAFGLLFGSLNSYDPASALALQQSNLSLLAGEAGIIGGRRGEWTVREDREVYSELPGLECSAENGEDIGGPPGVRFLLGDFAHLGAFLRDLSGRGTGAAEDIHAG
jgi:hypothetical protein